MTTATYVAEIDWANDGNYAHAQSDVTSLDMGTTIVRGRDFPSQLTGRSQAGTLRFKLNNDDGKFSDPSGSIGANLVPNRKIRIRTSAPSAKTLWTGFIRRIVPRMTAEHQRIAVIEGIGALSKLTGKQVNVAALTNTTTGPAVDAVLDDMGWPAPDRSIDTGDSVIPRWWASDRPSLSAIRELEASEFGFLNEAVDGKIAFEGRGFRATTTRANTSQATFSDATSPTLGYTSLRLLDPLREIANEIKTRAELYTVGAEAVLWGPFTEQTTINPTDTRTFWAEYPNAANPSGAHVDAWTTLDATDVTMVGTPVFADLGITLSKFSQTMKIAIQNNHATLPAVITSLRARGTPVTRDVPTTVRAEDSTSQTDFGTHTHTVRTPWWESVEFADQFVNAALSDYKDPLRVLEMTYSANKDANHMTQALTRDLSDRITIIADNNTAFGIASGDYSIESIRHDISDGKTKHMVTYLLSPVVTLGGDFVLDDVALGLLDTSALAL